MALILQDSSTKKSVFVDYLVEGKKCMMYFILYDISKGLKATSTAMMHKRALQLGGIRVHQLFNIKTKEILNLHRRVELSILNPIQKPQKTIFLRSIDMLAFDEMCKSSANVLATFGIILQK